MDSDHPRRRRWTGALAVLLIVVAATTAVILIVGPWRGTQPDEHEEEGRPAPLSSEQQARLTVRPAATREFSLPLVVPGELAFDEEHASPVFAPQEGLVRAILARPGDRVEAGQPLAEIESGEVVEAEAGLVAAVGGKSKSAAARLRAEHEAARARRLYDARAGSLKDQEEADAELSEAVAEDQGAEAELAASRRKLGLLGLGDADIAQIAGTRAVDRRAVLRAPIAGVVVARKLAPGQWVRAEGDEPLFAVADPSRIWLFGDVPETAAGLVRPGLEVEVAVPALPGQVFRAEIAWVAAALDPESRRLKARCEVPNPEGALKAGMAAEARIAQPPRRALAVPASAVVRDGEQSAVWVAGGDGSYARRLVALGAEEEGAVEVTRGLREGEAVVVAGAVYLDQRAVR